MKTTVLILILSIISINCRAQELTVKNLSDNLVMNYTFANIRIHNIYKNILFNGGLNVTIFQISDSKATPTGYFEESYEVLDSLIISVAPDGDYTVSKLFKIEGLVNPKIIEVKSNTFPKFTIKIEHGFFYERKTEIIELFGTNN